jgi:hypothetical protein
MPISVGFRGFWTYLCGVWGPYQTVKISGPNKMATKIMKMNYLLPGAEVSACPTRAVQCLSSLKEPDLQWPSSD